MEQTTEALIQAFMDIKWQIDSLEAQQSVIKDEILRRHKETGELSFEGETATSLLTKEAFSEAWFKREYGFEKKDLPMECITEKISAAIDWDKVSHWLQEEHNINLEPSYTVRIKAKKLI